MALHTAVVGYFRYSVIVAVRSLITCGVRLQSIASSAISHQQTVEASLAVRWSFRPFGQAVSEIVATNEVIQIYRSWKR
jgi:hypothetical protein